MPAEFEQRFHTGILDVLRLPETLYWGSLPNSTLNPLFHAGYPFSSVLVTPIVTPYRTCCPLILSASAPLKI
jgi:hypothetical protein